jgi:hypothetical protein
MSFTKLDSKIIDSSIWDEDANVLKVFIAFWTKCNPDGVVDATYNAMFRTANLCDSNKMPLPIAEFDRALTILLSNDPSSRTKIEGGKRIIKLEESKWLITTYKAHREYTYSNNPEAIKKRNQRNGTLGDMSQSVPDTSISASISNSKSEEKSAEKRNKNTIPPTIESINEYCIERKNNIVAQKFFDYYESKGWMIGKNKMKNWQAAVRTWENSSFNNQNSGSGKTMEEIYG